MSHTSMISPTFDCKRSVIRKGLQEGLIGKVLRVPRASFNDSKGLTGDDNLKVYGVTIGHGGNIGIHVKCQETKCNYTLRPFQLLYSGGVAIGKDQVYFEGIDTTYEPSNSRNREVAMCLSSHFKKNIIR